MSIFDNLILGFSVALSAWNILYCFIGVLVGTFIGVLPGIGPLVTIAVLLPVTFGLPADGAIIMLAGIYYGASYGGSTTAILVNLPGEASSVVTCIDGYQMACQGRAGQALAIAAIGSFIAGCFGTVLIALFGPILAQVALGFNAPDYFSLMLMALVATALFTHGSLLKAVLMSLTGVLFSLCGTDVYSGQERYTFGLLDLSEGLDFTVVAVGLFGFAEIIRSLETNTSERSVTSKVSNLMLSWREFTSVLGSILRGTAIGSFFGILPGTGPSISAYLSYMLERRVSRDRANFGRGALAGVAAPESANNAASQTSFIPTLTLGIPGGPTMALMLGALMIQGIDPGPQIITEQAPLFWGLIASMWIGNLMLLVLNLPLIGLWVQLLKTPYQWLYPSIVVFACVGVYSVSSSQIDVLLAALFAGLGYIFLKLKLELSPFILGFVLGPMIEENFRRAMIISHGDLMIFLERPISLAFTIVMVVLLIAMLIPAFRRGKEIATVE